MAAGKGQGKSANGAGSPKAPKTRTSTSRAVGSGTSDGQSARNNGKADVPPARKKIASKRPQKSKAAKPAEAANGAQKATAKKKATTKKAPAKKASAKKTSAKKVTKKTKSRATAGAPKASPERAAAKPRNPAKSTTLQKSADKKSSRSPAAKPSSDALTLGPTLDSVLGELQKLGKPNTAKIYARHGVSEKSVGLAYADLKQLVKRLGTQHDLAQQLWQSGIHDARILATKISDPARVSAKQLEGWLSDASNHIVTAAIAGLAAKGQAAVDLAKRWIQSAQEWRSAAGWSVLTEAALSGKLGDEDAEHLLEHIRERIHDAANRTRYAMNNTLIAIGGANERLRPLALKVAEAIGEVEVDHGETGCKTPDAKSYIRKMVEHEKRPGRASKGG